ncbi:MAG: peptidylprolyl isomerase [Planctomycetes bacterium]|nr:peptidylprolyl isomerase [Planctomycetota bacterium]
MIAHEIAFLLAAAFPCPQDPDRPPASAPTADPVIATIRDREIRLSELIEEVDRQIPLNFYHRRVPPDQLAEFQRDAFDKLVVKHLIHMDALDSGITADDEEVRAEFESALAEAGGAYQTLEAGPREQLFLEVRAALVRRTLIRKNENQLAARVPKLDEKHVRSIYDERIAADDSAFMAPQEARFHHIFVAVDPSRIAQEEDVKKSKIEAALAEIRQGQSFASIARIYSEDEYAATGGDIGFQQAGSFRMKSLNEHAFEMRVGETSEVIRSLHGFHLLYCAEIKPPARHPFEVMRPEIESWLRSEHLTLARGRWLAALRAKYPVQMLRPELLEAHGDDAQVVPGKATEPESAPPAKSSGK